MTFRVLQVLALLVLLAVGVGVVTTPFGEGAPRSTLEVILMMLAGGAVVGMVATLGWPSDKAGLIFIVVFLAISVGGSVGTVLWQCSADWYLQAGSACLGQGVDEADDAAGPGPLKLVVLTDDGEWLQDWTNADASWQAESLDQVGLVACVDRRKENAGRCRYTTGVAESEVETWDDVADVRLVVARTGQEVGQLHLVDESPPCAEELPVGVSELNGEISLDSLTEAFERYLDPSSLE